MPVTRKQKLKKTTDGQPKTIGLIMPLSQMGIYTKEHWDDVRKCLSTKMCLAAPAPTMVSEAAEVNFITKTIINRLFNDDIVICDISGLNPNVMFELGLRIAFEKPVVIVKDDITKKPSFDIAHIEYLEYPSDMNKIGMDKFIKQLKAKVKATFADSKKNTTQTILQQYGIMTHKNKNSDSDIINVINSLSRSISNLQDRLSRQDYMLNRINQKVNPKDPNRFVQDRANPYDDLSYVYENLYENFLGKYGNSCGSLFDKHVQIPKGELK